MATPPKSSREAHVLPEAWFSVVCFRAMLGIWITLVVLMCLRAAIWPKRNSLYPTFADTGQCWLHSADLYDTHFWTVGVDQYRYAPLVTVFFVPFSVLPDAAGGVLWRLVNMAAFFGGVITYCCSVYPGRNRVGSLGAALIGFVLIPLSLPSLNNGQANPLVIGCLLLGLVAAYQGRWNWAALALAVPIFFKLYPVALAMLLLLVYPRQLGWRLVVFLVAGTLLPFATQDWSYASRQYAQWFDKLVQEDRSTRVFADSYRDFWLLVRVAHVPLSHEVYRMLQFAMGAGLAVVILVGRMRRWPAYSLLHSLLGLACCWMLLFGPATENCTYILMAPTAGLAVWEAFVQRRPIWTRAMLLGIVGIFVGNAIITALPNGRHWAYALNPLAALLLFCERLLSLWAVDQCRPATNQVPSAAAKAA
jgi:hypothetical protein